VGEVQARNTGDGSYVNRWQRLVSIIGGLITGSAVAGELTGYLHFLGNANDLLDVAINALAVGVTGHAFGKSTLLFLKVAFALVSTWILFFLALLRYSIEYERTTLRL
jgi:hypothetical protein